MDFCWVLFLVVYCISILNYCLQLGINLQMVVWTTVTVWKRGGIGWVNE